MRSLHRSFVVAFAAVLCWSAAGALAAPAQSLSRQDQRFLDQAWNINTTEIHLGHLAEQRATNADVKAFGKRMVADHSKLNQEVMSLAQQHDFTLPKALSRSNQALIEKLSKLSGSDFDKQYMTSMIEGHEHAVAAFEKESKDRAQTSVDQWAGHALPTLREHLQLAEKTGKEIGVSVPTAITAGHEEHPAGK